MTAHEKIVKHCDRLFVVFFCGLIYFLPISIALGEWFSGLAIVTFFVKRTSLYLAAERPTEARSTFSGIRQWLKAYEPVVTPLNRAIGIFVLINFLSILFSQYPVVSVKGFFFKLLQNVFVFFAFLEGIRTKKRLKAFLVVLMVSATLVSINGLVQYFRGKGFIFGYPMWNEGRINSCFYQSNDLASYLLVAIFPAMAFVLSNYLSSADASLQKIFKKTYRWDVIGFKVVQTICFLLYLICLGLTFSRGAWIGFFCALVFLAVVNKRMIIPLVLIGALFVWFFFPRLAAVRQDIYAYYKSAEAASRQEGGDDQEEHDPFVKMIFKKMNRFVGAGSGRITYWEEATAIIRDYPILGVGINAYSRVGNRYQLSWGGYPHNCFLQMAAEIGIFGLLVFLWIVFKSCWASLRHLVKTNDKFIYAVVFGFLGALISFLIHSASDTNLYSAKLGSLVWLMWAVLFAAIRIDSLPGQERP